MSAIIGDLFAHDESGEWVTIQEAARRLGVGERSIRRRVSHGDFSCRTHADGKREIFLRESSAEPSGDVVGGIDPERAIQLVDRISVAVTRQLDALTVELASSRDRVETLARENGMLTERVSGLERELSAARESAAHEPSAPPESPASSSVEREELAAVRRTNQRQVEELARMAAELNAFKIAQDEAATSAEAGTPGVVENYRPPTPSRTPLRPPVQPVAPWWRTWWVWVCIVIIVASFVVLIRVTVG